MGGELGSLVASMTERTEWAGDILGFDVDPPRRNLKQAKFVRVSATDWVEGGWTVEDTVRLATRLAARG